MASGENITYIFSLLSESNTRNEFAKLSYIDIRETLCTLCCQVERKDLTHLKVYAIDVDEADEVHLVDLNEIFVCDY